MTTTALVLGATGTTGGRLTARLLAGGHRVRAASRGATAVGGATPVRFDWYDPGTWQGAVGDADRVYLVPPLGATSPADTMLPFLRLARAAGVRRAVLLSSSAIPAGGPATGLVHQALPGLFPEWAVLRPSWFMQNFTGDHMHAHTVRDEAALYSATGEGRVGFVDADDIAEVALHALTDTHAPGTDLVLTGPEALRFDDVAAILGDATGRTVTHRRLTRAQMRDRLAASLPAEFAGLLADMDDAIARGAEDRTTDTVLRLTGRPPRDFRTHVAHALGEAGTVPVPR
ncbi:NAD(P)H-binding protein [Streptomyces minutiscleroticus]|uniref:NAD(P)H-binding protein n=1 Tax=Streptomyces minutiscleroticus TaxID=68238 RepID=UPI0033311161